ncbi:MAG TPA: mannan-binding lectin [Polyangia bacterium]|jgi:hypothetical protein|nr:mannan-binding lectin [Polyangia bacterium]
MSTYTISIPAGPIWNNEDAQVKGKAVAAAHGGTFNGQWRTVVPSVMSTVDVVLPADPNTGPTKFKCMVPAGPLWNNDEAQKIGPTIAASYGGRFTGQWSTNIPGKMSLIEVEFSIS